MQTRIKVDNILKTTQVSIFNSDPVTWIPQDHVTDYKREVAWHLFEMTQVMNMECWGVIVDALFKEQSKTIFSLVYQLSKTYHRSTLSCLTSAWESHAILKKLSSIFRTHIILYKPNYIPQYIKVKTHYLNLITARSTTTTVDRTLLIYSEPIEYLFSMDFNFQLSALTDLRFKQDIKTFFDMSNCIIDIQSFDKIGNIDPDIEWTRRELFQQKFNEDPAKVRYKAFVALRCDFGYADSFPDEWWPYPDDRPLAIPEFVLLLIKVSTSYAGTVLIIYQDKHYCICGDICEAEMMVCKISDNGVLTMPCDLHYKDIDSTYQREPLLSLYNNKNLFVY
ncbi:hypothetical protein INT47_010804 [Mucor saturninus]|uniref:Uncharacterized protein n=1 Tax=Mucor saturninus TaxID=64648 RepID=A0A8H7V0L2_9FUNG|nr:hypothetical protein INT47_010804 [Mucor saturninus]